MPEGRGEAKLLPKRIDLSKRLAPPIKLHAVMIPGLSKLPLLLKRDDLPARLIPQMAPAIHVFFRPEEQDRLSGKDNVLPPILWGNGEVNNP